MFQFLWTETEPRLTGQIFSGVNEAFGVGVFLSQSVPRGTALQPAFIANLGFENVTLCSTVDDDWKRTEP